MYGSQEECLVLVCFKHRSIFYNRVLPISCFIMNGTLVSCLNHIHEKYCPIVYRSVELCLIPMLPTIRDYVGS
jgi:hypothetical protein